MVLSVPPSFVLMQCGQRRPGGARARASLLVHARRRHSDGVPYSSRPVAATRRPPGAAGRGGRARGRRPQAPKASNATVDLLLLVLDQTPRAGIRSRGSPELGVDRDHDCPRTWGSHRAVTAFTAGVSPFSHDDRSQRQRHPSVRFSQELDVDASASDATRCLIGSGGGPCR